MAAEVPSTPSLGYCGIQTSTGDCSAVDVQGFEQACQMQHACSTSTDHGRVDIVPAPKLHHAGLAPSIPPTKLSLSANNLGTRSSIFDMLPQHPAPMIERRRDVSPPARPAPGTLELPSAGSAKHYAGKCKPCVFLHKKGCENGVACQFCHLCPADAKKMRRQEKFQQRKDRQMAVRKTSTV